MQFYSRAGLAALTLLVFVISLASSSPIPPTSIRVRVNEPAPSTHSLSKHSFDARIVTSQDRILIGPKYSTHVLASSAKPYDPESAIARRSIFDKIKSAFQKVGNGIKNAAQKVGGAIKSAAQKVGGAVKTAAQKVGNGVKAVAQKVGNGVKAVAQKVGNGVKAVAQKVGNGVKTAAQKVGNGVKKAAQKVGGAVKSAAQKVGKGVVTAAKKVASGVKTAAKFVKDNGAKVAKFGLKVLSTAQSVAAKAVSFVPGVGKIASKALKAASMGTNAASNAIHAQLPGNLEKGMGIMDKIQNPLSGAGGAVLDAVFRREDELSERDVLNWSDFESRDIDVREYEFEERDYDELEEREFDEELSARDWNEWADWE